MYWIVYGYMKKVGCLEPKVYYNYDDAREEFDCLAYEYKQNQNFLMMENGQLHAMTEVFTLNTAE